MFDPPVSPIDHGTVIPAAVTDPERLAALHATGLLDSEAEETFDRFTRLASRVIGAPVALLSLVDADRQFFKSEVGLTGPAAEARQTPLSHSFCQYVVSSADDLLVSDSRNHVTLHDNLAIRDLGVVAYAGVPVRDSNGHVLGSFCVIDAAPREWTQREVETLHDIAEAVHSELLLRERNAALETQHSLLDAILASIQDGVLAIDREGRPVLANPAMQDAFAAADGDELELEAPRSRARRVDPITRVAAPVDVPPSERALAGDVVRGERITTIDRDGAELHLVVSAAPLRDEAGDVTGAVTTMHDVTAQVKAERMKEEFFALVSHELRTPLAGILGYLELLDEEEGHLLTDTGRTFVNAMERQSQRLLRLVGDLLFAAQVESGTLSLTTGTFSLADIASDAVQSAQLRASDKALAVDLEVQDAFPELVGDRDRMAQVLDNLLTNAIKFTDQGVVTLRLSYDDAEACIEVADTGIGIPPEEQAQLFERFARASAATELAIPGVGLGLAITKAIVEGHGGTIELESEVGRGTTFRVRLPRVPD